MTDQMRRRLAAPEFPDEEKTRVAQLLTSVLWLVLGASLVSLLPVALRFGEVRRTDTRIPQALLLLGLGLGSLVLQWAVRRGWVRIAAGILVIALWGSVTAWLWLVSGISGSWLPYLYPVILVIAGVLLGSGGALVFLGLGIVGVVGSYLIEQQTTSMGLSGGASVQVIAMSLALGALTWVLVRGQRGLVAITRAAQERAAENERASRQLEAIQASVEHRVAERTRELTVSTDAVAAVVEIGRAAASAETVQALADEVSSLIADRFACYHVGLYLLDEGAGGARGELGVLRARGGIGGTGVPDLGYEVPMAEGSVFAEAVRAGTLKLAFGSGVPRAAFALAQEALSMHRARLPESAVEVVLPLSVGSAHIGVVDMHISDLSTFYQQSLEPLRILADQVAVAIVAVRRLEQAEEALAAERERYRQSGQEGWIRLLQSGMVPGYRLRGQRIEPAEDIWYPEMEVALDQETRVVRSANGKDKEGVSRASVPLVDTDSEDLVGNGQQGSESDYDISGNEGGILPGEIETVDGKGAVAAVPLRIREQTIGVLHIRKRPGTGDWGTNELELLDTLTDQLEAALESAWLYGETQKAAIQQRTIAEVGSRIREEVDIESVLARALAELGSALAAEQGAVLLTLQEPGEEAA